MKTLKTLSVILASLLIISCGCSNLIDDYDYENNTDNKITYSEVGNDESEVNEKEETIVNEESKENTEIIKKSVKKENSISENEEYEMKGYEILYVIKDCNINIKQINYDVVHNEQSCFIKTYNHDCAIESIRLYFNYHEPNGYTENNLYIYHVNNDIIIYSLNAKHSCKPYINSASFENNTLFIDANAY